MTHRAAIFTSVVCLFGAASGCTGTLTDADDGGPSDASAPWDGEAPADGEIPPAIDGGPIDGIDAGRDDGGPLDAGPLDAGVPDAGSPLDAGPPSSRQVLRPLGTTAADQGYLEYLPPRYGDGRSHPLLVFLHGLGENGDGDADLGRVANNGPPRLIERDDWADDRPFVVLSPQNSRGGCHRASDIRAFIEHAVATYDVDASRIYLTGLSCGAIGAWGYLGQHLDERVAAAVLIAGNGNGAWNNAGCELGRIPIWAFHGDADSTVNVSGTIDPMTNLSACDPAPVDARMTIYPGVGHDSWSRTYDGSAGHDIYGWMLGKVHP